MLRAMTSQELTGWRAFWTAKYSKDQPPPEPAEDAPAGPPPEVSALIMALGAPWPGNSTEG